MEAWLESSIHAFLAAFALPEIGMSAIFIVSLVSATLLPLGSEPAVFAYVKLNPDMFWPAVVIATLGNTIGGIISYAMGSGAQIAWHKIQDETKPVKNDRWHRISEKWFAKLGPPALLLSWLPGIGDPLCAVAGWLKLSFWPSVMYMAIGKFLRYVFLTMFLLQAWDWFI